MGLERIGYRLLGSAVGRRTADRRECMSDGRDDRISKTKGVPYRSFTALLGAIVTLALLPSMAAAAGEFEPNDNRDAASGPLEGGRDYTARFETDNDVDWYVFYVRQYSQMDFSATGAPDCIWALANVELRDLDGKSISGFESGWTGETNHLYLTLNPSRYYLEIRNPSGECIGDPYRFRIEPATAVTPSRECGEAIVAKDALVPLLVKADEDLAANARVLGHAKRKTRQAGRKLRRLKKHNRANRWRMRSARRQFRRAKRSRNQLWRTRKYELGAAKQQHQQTLAHLDGQIAAYC